MVTVGLYVTLEAKPGREDDVAAFLQERSRSSIRSRGQWRGLHCASGPTRFAIFDAFPDDSRRDARLAGAVAAVLMEQARELLAESPKIEQVDVLADKLPT